MIKKFLIAFNLFVLIGCTNGQQELEIVVEGETAVSVDTFIIRINILSNDFLETELEGQLNYFTKKDVLNRLKTIKDLKRIDKKNYLKEYENEQEFSIEYIEIYGKESYKAFVDSFKFRTPFFIEEIKLNDVEYYERKLVNSLIDKSKTIAKKRLQEKSKEVIRLLGYIEIKQEQMKEKEPIKSEESSGFQILKEKFIEYGYNGYRMNTDGEIVIEKKIIVTWEIK